jgi:hypothetical protein
MSSSNTFSYEKCHNFGKSLPKEWTKGWGELEKDPTWIEFKKRRGLTDNQLYYIHLGFVGKPFQSTEKRDEKESDVLDDELFPFGIHKGKRFAEIHPNYLRWFLNQTWYEKWPTVAVYAKRKIEDLDNNKLSADEVKNLLKLD